VRKRTDDKLAEEEQTSAQQQDPHASKTVANSGVVDWLLECPEKDFFTAVESESTDSLEPRRR
jgi:hypothetical protein